MVWFLSVFMLLAIIVTTCTEKVTIPLFLWGVVYVLLCVVMKSFMPFILLFGISGGLFGFIYAVVGLVKLSEYLNKRWRLP